MFGAKNPVFLLMSVAALALPAAPVIAAQQVESPSAGRGCVLVVETGPDQWVINYDPFVDTTVERQFDLAVVNRGDQPCSGVVGLDLKGEPFGLNQAGAGERLAYAVVDERASTDITPRAGVNVRSVGARPLNLAAGERGMLRFSVMVDPADLPTAGLYTQTAFLTLDEPDGTPLSEKPITLGVRVPSAALMGLKGEFRRSGGVATIDLGPISEGTRPLNTTLYVLSTAGYKVSVASTNLGRLRQGVSGWYVPYTLTVGDRTVNLATPQSLLVDSTRARLDNYPLAVNLGSATGLKAGSYTDTVTFTISAI